MKLLNFKMDGLKASIKKQLKSKADGLQEALTTLVNDNMTSLKVELKAELALKIQEIQGNLDRERGHVVARMEQMELKLSPDQERVNSRFDPDVTVIISGVTLEEEEDVLELVGELLADGLGWEDDPPTVVATERMKERGDNPGVVKVEFTSVNDKVTVLRKKQSLKSREKFQGVYIRSAKTHAERLVELNFRTLLNEIPAGKKFFVTGNGRVRRKRAGEQGNAAGDASGEASGHGAQQQPRRGGGGGRGGRR